MKKWTNNGRNMKNKVSGLSSQVNSLFVAAAVQTVCLFEDGQGVRTAVCFC